MPHTITGVSGGAYVGSCTAPSPGDAVTAASVYNGEQAILDDAAFFNECITGVPFEGAISISAVAATNNPALTATGDGTGAGLVAQGGATAPGVTSVAGASASYGLVGTGGTGSATGVRAVAGLSGGWALEVATGNQTFAGTAPAKTADPGAHALSAANICRAWGKFTTDGAAGVTNNDGYNIASVSLSGGTHAVITFARAIAANYAPQVSSGDGLSIPWADLAAATTTVLNVYFNDFAGVAINPATNALIFTLHVDGR